MSQLPFGSVPFRHTSSTAPWATTDAGLNCLSAQCPFGTGNGRSHGRRAHLVSIAFRLKALSAREYGRPRHSTRPSESQLPFGSKPFRLTGLPVPTSSYGSTSQLPFGSKPFRLSSVLHLKKQGPSGVSIAFRLKALSARSRVAENPETPPLVSIAFRLKALSAQSPFGSTSATWTSCSRAQASQLPFGSKPFRLLSSANASSLATMRVSIAFRLKALSARFVQKA